MTQTIKKSIEMLEMLPESEQEFANQIIERIVLAWDPDYTKLTPNERRILDEAEKRMDNGDYISSEELI